MALLGFVATIFAWVLLQLIEYFESETNTETRLESNPKSCHNQVPTADVQEATGRTHITPQPDMWKPERASALLPDSTASMDKNTERSPVNHLPATRRITEEYVKNLENDNQNLKNEIGVCQDRFQNVSAMLHGVDEIVEEKERLQDEVRSLKEIVAKYESDSRNQEKRDDSDELKQLRDENSNLKTNLETSACMTSFQSEEIKNLTATTIALNKKLEKASLKNDELILKLATSRHTALTITDRFHEIESKLEKEIHELKEQLKSKEKVLEEKEATLESTQKANEVAAQKVEDIHNSKQKLEVAHEKNLVLTSLNNQLQDELTELKRTIEQIRAEYRLLSEASDATSLSAKEAQKLAEQVGQLADEREAANGLLQSSVTLLQKELAASLSQIDEFKKEKAVQLYNAATWEATESQLRNEIVNLKALTQTQNETLSSTMTELERAKDENGLLTIGLEFVRATLTEKSTENDKLTTRNSDLVSEKSLLELNNENLKKEAEDCRIELERLKKENQKLLDTQEETVFSLQKSTKLAEEQVDALSEALVALREAVKHTKNAAEATKTERKSMNSGSTTTEKRTKGNWVGEMFAKRKARKNEDGCANLLESTGLRMVERAKILQDHAQNIKEKGKVLKRKAKTLQK